MESMTRNDQAMLQDSNIDFSNVTKKEIIGVEFFESIYAIKEENRRQYVLSLAEQRAQELTVSRQFNKAGRPFCAARR